MAELVSYICMSMCICLCVCACAHMCMCVHVCIYATYLYNSFFQIIEWLYWLWLLLWISCHLWGLIHGIFGWRSIVLILSFLIKVLMKINHFSLRFKKWLNLKQIKQNVILKFYKIVFFWKLLIFGISGIQHLSHCKRVDNTTMSWLNGIFSDFYCCTW